MSLIYQEKKYDPSQQMYRDCLRPLADIYENETSYTIIMDMPGVDKENLDITIHQDVLTVHGACPNSVDRSAQKGRVIHQEFSLSPGYFRAFRISKDTVDEDNIGAAIEKGVLTITLNKAEKAKPKKIIVQS